MLKRRDFRSLSARFPWLVFGVLPVLALSLAMLWHILVLVVLKNLSAPALFPSLEEMVLFTGNFILVPAIVLLFVFIARRQRLSLAWPILSTAIILFLSPHWDNQPVAGFPPGFSAFTSCITIPTRQSAAASRRFSWVPGGADRGAMGDIHCAVPADPVAAGLAAFAVIAGPKQSHETPCPVRAAACHARARAGHGAGNRHRPGQFAGGCMAWHAGAVRLSRPLRQPDGHDPDEVGTDCRALLPHRSGRKRTGNVLPPVWNHGPRDCRGWPCPDWRSPHGLRGRTARRQQLARAFPQPFLAGIEPGQPGRRRGCPRRAAGGRA